MAPAAPGYSGTPLVKKLGLQPGAVVCVIDAPAPYGDIVDGLPADVRVVTRAAATTRLVHVFAREAARLQRTLAALRDKLPADAAVWMSWPKKASGVASDISENTVRELALPLGFVDVKVCAIDATWSGLKLVVRRALR